MCRWFGIGVGSDWAHLYFFKFNNTFKDTFKKLRVKHCKVYSVFSDVFEIKFSSLVTVHTLNEQLCYCTVQICECNAWYNQVTGTV